MSFLNFSLALEGLFFADSADELVILTQAPLPARVLPFFGNGRVTESQTMRQQTRASRVGVGYRHEGFGGPHGRRCVRLNRFLPGALVKNLDHGILLNDLSMEVLYPAEKISCFAKNAWLDANLSLPIAAKWICQYQPPPEHFWSRKRLNVNLCTSVQTSSLSGGISGKKTGTPTGSPDHVSRSRGSS